MRWALPERVTRENIDYAKHCIALANRTLVCGCTMKTKRLNNEQYCKHFVQKSELDEKMDELYKNEEIENLKKMIIDYELNLNLRSEN